MIQRISAWNPPDELKFEMVSTDHSWGNCVESIQEHFLLKAEGPQTTITRRTTLRAADRWKLLKETLFAMGLKRVHFYVFRNWRLQAGK